MGDRAREIFFEIHRGLPREGPGDSASTRKAFSMLADLPPQPKILDIGCGPGKQTLDLAALTDGEIIAVDNHQPYLDALEEQARQQGLSDRIRVMNTDMFALKFPEASFDVIWAEGSIYIIGFARGLKEWKALLRKSGYLAASELTWLKPDPPDEARKYLEEAYPAMQDVEGNLQIIKDSGYKTVDYFALPESAWWDDYYAPLEGRLKILQEKYKGDEEALAVLEMERAEIDLYRKYSDFYGYVFYIMQKR
ncbi:MAG TPA: class I SAM-dependent methyltransferase [Blastocatellia bacterium]|nr:class I SAM-dependent methyltransferase [Blastocatellia bacterium]